MSPRFICDLFTPGEANVIVFGIPLGKDSNKALNSLRKASDYIEPFDLDKKRNLLDDIKVADIGDLRLKKLDEITTKTKEILEVKKTPLVLSGGHLSTYYTLKAFKDVKLIVFDAHTDLKNEYRDKKINDLNFFRGIKFDPKLNDATWLRRACEFIDPKNILLLGVRSCDEFDFDFMEKNGISYFTPNHVKNNIKKVKDRIKEFVNNSKIYISIDIDVFDPSVAPAVHHPEPNGLFLHEFIELINATDKTRIVGMDLCCIKHTTDNKTGFLATRAVFEVLSLLSR